MDSSAVREGIKTGPEALINEQDIGTLTIAELLPCVDTPSPENSDAALERMEQERDRLSEHITDVVRTRDALDELITANRTGPIGGARGRRWPSGSLAPVTSWRC